MWKHRGSCADVAGMWHMGSKWLGWNQMIMMMDATILCSIRGGESESIKGAAGERTTYLRRVGRNGEQLRARSIAVNLRPHVPERESQS